MESFEELLKDQPMLGKISLADMEQIDLNDLEELYSVAHRLYNLKNIDGAVKILSLLCACNHTDIRFWTGLGYCRKFSKDYQGALSALVFAQSCDGSPSPEVYLQMVECCMFLGDYQSASIYARAALNCECGDKLKTSVQMLLSASESHISHAK